MIKRGSIIYRCDRNYLDLYRVKDKNDSINIRTKELISNKDIKNDDDYIYLKCDALLKLLVYNNDIIIIVEPQIQTISGTISITRLNYVSNIFINPNATGFGICLNQNLYSKHNEILSNLTKYNDINFVDIYLTDKLESIISLFNDKIKNLDFLCNHIGGYKSFKDFLEKIDFMKNIYNIFGINTINYKLSEGFYIDKLAKKEIESLIDQEMGNVIIKKYSKEIIIPNIKLKYNLIYDKYGDLYIVAYYDPEVNMYKYDDIDKNISTKLISQLCK